MVVVVVNVNEYNPNTVDSVCCLRTLLGQMKMLTRICLPSTPAP